ncbi:hypothetical protein Stsp02_16440 [Streptomyces sp. NBRC 14336]|nr:hypothetical protein Stsp02_16440 [Streptomyces sp. NBRC 14336]
MVAILRPRIAFRPFGETCRPGKRVGLPSDSQDSQDTAGVGGRGPGPLVKGRRRGPEAAGRGAAAKAVVGEPRP